MARTTLTAIVATSLGLVGCMGGSTGLHGAADATGDTLATDVVADTVVDVPVDTGPHPTPYALHEWGVFVYEYGATGATVHGPSPEAADPMVDKPVIYVYSDEELVLDLTVDFASGAATEVWPQTDLGSFVSWQDVRVSPGACDPTPFPSIWDEPWVYEYCEACTLGTCVVEDASCLSTADQVAKLLFYAGHMPGMAAPLSGIVELIEDPEGSRAQFDVRNDSTSTVRGVWLMYRNTTSVCEFYEYCPVATADLAVGFISSLEPGAGMTMELPVVHLEAELDGSGMPIPGTLGAYDEWDEVPHELALALVEQGLYAAEADAFIAAWHVAMFGLLGGDSYTLEPLYRNGASLLYFMDRGQYDAQLPLTVSPTPEELVRVGMIYQHI